MAAKRPKYAGQLRRLKLCRFALQSIFFLFFWSITALPVFANSLHSNWIGDPKVGEVRLISAVSATGVLKELPLGLEFRLAPGWKIYWRTPGEAGLPPKIDLLAGGKPITSRIKWPVPKRFNTFGFDNFGYDNTVILPLRITGFRPETTVRLLGNIEALVCADICVPLDGTVELTIPAGAASATIDSHLIAQSLAMVPRLGSTRLFAVEQVWQVGEALYMQFTGTPAIDDILIEGVEGVAFKKPRINGTNATIAIETSMPTNLAGRDITATIIAGDQFSEQSFTIAATEQNILVNDYGWVIFIIAWIGGLILNLMPCVLPVLAIKIATIVQSAGQQKSMVRIRFFSAAAGIVTSFLILATVLAVMRAAGKQIGWGVQFQSPFFLSAMILLLGVFVLIMLDRLVMPIPAFAQRLTQSFGGVATPRRQVAGDFLTGMLATILATPCSAPFVGVAVGIALTGSLTLLFGIFIALGVGLATPWILIMLVPGLISALPKPGAWMIWLKRVLAFFLCGTILWLGTILFVISGGPLTVMLSVGLSIVIWGLTERNRIISRSVVFCGAVALLILLTNSSSFVATSESKASADAALFEENMTSVLAWQDWQSSKVGPLVSEGKTVFVDVTAAWCITCKANKSIVIDRAPVAPILKKLVDSGDLVLLQADWTRPNDDIAAFLASYKRYGIPFNIVYGPHAMEGIELGELLTVDTLLAALKRAMTGS